MDNNNKPMASGDDLTPPQPPDQSALFNERAEHYLREPGVIEDVPSSQQVQEAEESEQREKHKADESQEGEQQKSVTSPSH